MAFVNEANKWPLLDSNGNSTFPLTAQKSFVLLLAPLAPHLSEHLWQNHLGQCGSVAHAKWPIVDASLLAEEMCSIVILQNGKKRGIISVPTSVANDEGSVIEAAQQQLDEQLWDRIAPHTSKRRIFVPGKILNFVR